MANYSRHYKDLLVNLTPNTISIITEFSTVVIPPSTEIEPLRVESKEELVSWFGDFNIVKSTLGELNSDLEFIDQSLPKSERKFYLVSRIVKTKIQELYPTLADLYFLVPNGLVRDTEGKVIGCKNLSL